MRRESKSTTGSVVKDRRSQTWQFFWWIDGKRHSKTLGRFPTKTAAWNAAQTFRSQLPQPQPTRLAAPTVADLVEQYRIEKMPQRYSTRRSYDAWLSNHIIPKFGQCAISDVQARPAELWLESLSLTARSRAAVRGLLRILWDYAMWRGDVATQRNPMELVTIKGATKRTQKPRSLTVAEFQKFIVHLGEPFRTTALICVCFGLRISEALALRWSDVDWLNGKLKVERGIVCQQVDDVKTSESRRSLHVTAEMLGTLKLWKQTTQFPAQEDWIFASPFQIGRLPWSYDQVWRAYQKAGAQSGIGALGTHVLRHTFRSWLDSVGTSLAVQQKLMRHADIRTTMNVYGDIVTDEMSVASGKVAGLALNGTEHGTGSIPKC
jgi:integrase